MIVSIIDSILFFVGAFFLLVASYPFPTWGAANVTPNVIILYAVICGAIGLAVLGLTFFLEKRFGQKSYLFCRLAIITQALYLIGLIGLMSATGFNFLGYNPYCGILVLALLILFTVPFWKRAKENKLVAPKEETTQK